MSGKKQNRRKGFVVKFFGKSIVMGVFLMMSVFVFLGFWGTGDTDFERRLKTVLDSNNGTVYLKDLTSFKWDRVYIFHGEIGSDHLRHIAKERGYPMDIDRYDLGERCYTCWAIVFSNSETKQDQGYIVNNNKINLSLNHQYFKIEDYDKKQWQRIRETIHFYKRKKTEEGLGGCQKNSNQYCIWYKFQEK